MTKIVFESLGDLVTGVLDITWCFINTSDCVPKNGNDGNGGKPTEDQKSKKPKKNESDDETT